MRYRAHSTDLGWVIRDGKNSDVDVTFFFAPYECDDNRCLGEDMAMCLAETLNGNEDAWTYPATFITAFLLRNDKTPIGPLAGPTEETQRYFKAAEKAFSQASDREGVQVGPFKAFVIHPVRRDDDGEPDVDFSRKAFVAIAPEQAA